MNRQVTRTIVIVAALLLVFSGLAIAEPIKIKFSHSQPPKTMENAIHATAVAFKYVIESRSGGKFEVQIYPAGSLGKDMDQMEAVKNGVIQMNFAPMVSLFRVYLPMTIGFSPYLFKNEDIAIEVFNGPFGQKLLDGLTEKSGLKGLDYLKGYNYMAITNNKRAIRSPEDMKGLKFRVMDPMGVAMFKSFGASAVPLAFAELFTSMQTGVVDGQTNPPFIVESMKFNEVQKYMTLAKSQWGYQVLICNKQWFEKLSPADQKLIRNSYNAASSATMGLSLLLEKEAVEKLKKKGMKVNVIPETDLPKFEKLARPAGLAFMRKAAGDALVDELLKAIDDAEKKLGYK